MEQGGKPICLKTNLPEKNQLFSTGSSPWPGGLGFPKTSFGWCGVAPWMPLHAFSSNGFKTPGSFSQPSCPWSEPRNEDSSSETCGTTFMLKCLYKLIQILNWKDHSYSWKGSDLNTQRPCKCSMKIWNFYHRTKFWWFKLFLNCIQWEPCWSTKPEKLSKEYLGISKEGSI